MENPATVSRSSSSGSGIITIISSKRVMRGIYAKFPALAEMAVSWSPNSSKSSSLLNVQRAVVAGQHLSTNSIRGRGSIRDVSRGGSRTSSSRDLSRDSSRSGSSRDNSSIRSSIRGSMALLYGVLLLKSFRCCSWCTLC